jgi:internalin A
VFTVCSPLAAVTGDLDRDGDVDFDDFFIFSDNFGRTGSPDDSDTITVVLRDTITIAQSDTTIITLRDTVTVRDTVFVVSDTTTGGSPLFFGDPNLESAVRDALSKPTGNLLSGEVATLTFLNASNRNIVVLTGIENLTGLTSLTLSDNQIIDIGPLEQLTALRSLTLANNQVRDVSALVANSGIGTGATVVLTGNPLVNLATSQQIPALVARGATVSADPTVVTFPDSSLEAVVRTVLVQPTGDILSIDLGFISSLDASNKGITSLSGIEHMSSLTEFLLNDNSISNLSPLANLTGLTKLHLARNQVVALDSLARLTMLQDLDLQANQVSALAPLSSLTELSLLVLSQNQIADLTPLSQLTSLTVLTLDLNQIVDITNLSGLTQLLQLNLIDNLVVEVQSLVTLSQLTDLWLNGNPLSNTAITVHIPQIEANGTFVRR